MEGAASRKDGGIYLLASLRSQLSDPQVPPARGDIHAHKGGYSEATRGILVRVAFSFRSWARMPARCTCTRQAQVCAEVCEGRVCRQRRSAWTVEQVRADCGAKVEWLMTTFVAPELQVPLAVCAFAPHTHTHWTLERWW
jgi:hypothetical protein